MNIKQLAIVILLFAVATNMNAQFKIDAQYRLRGQVLNGYKKPVKKDVDAAIHIGQRTRLNLRYNTEKYSTLLSMQDVRTWGDANNVNVTGVAGKSFNNMDIYEAWVNFKFTNAGLKLGRQEMKYDDQRHISWRNWWDTGMTYDAATYTYKNKETGWRFDVSASYNSTKQDLLGNDYSSGVDYFGTVNPIQTQSFIYVKKSYKKMFVSLLAITSGFQKETNPAVLYMTNTEGIHLNYNATKKGTDGLFGVANAFLQNGSNIAGKKINANMLTAKIGYRALEKKLEVAGFFERLSGHDAKNTDTDYNDEIHTYNLLGGARHPYYEGYLDWFVVPGSSKGGGLMTIGLNVNYKLNKKDMLKFAYNNVSLATNVANGDGGYYGSALASTVDFTYIRKINKDIKWMNGFSYGAPSDDFNKMKGIAVADKGSNYFFYTMVIFTPKFFNSAKK
ncbi:MAG TPA: hypothetical protein EYG92_03750 [Lutibacter sp.]|nr:hypothetical protein [Lutibacter sp.]